MFLVYNVCVHERLLSIFVKLGLMHLKVYCNIYRHKVILNCRVYVAEWRHLM